MSVDVEILGENEDGRLAKANVVKRNGHNGIVVFNRELHNPAAATFPLINSTYGRAMNQAVSFAGTPEGIHNGTDTTWWTGSALSGTWDFASTTQAHAGTKSIDATATSNNDEAQLLSGAPVDANAYVALSGWIFIDGWSTSGSAKDVTLRFRLAGADIGLELDLSGYIDTSSFNVWQSFIIPTTDFSSGSIDQLIVKTVDVGAGQAPDYYLDDMQLEDLNGFLDFTYAPNPDQIFNLEKVATIFTDTIAEIGARNPLGILGLGPLTNGFLLQFDVSDQAVQSLPVTNLVDLIKFGQVEPIETVSDGITTMLKVTGNTTITLDGRDRDSITYRIQDDMSGLLGFEVWLFGRIEDTKDVS